MSAHAPKPFDFNIRQHGPAAAREALDASVRHTSTSGGAPSVERAAETPTAIARGAPDIIAQSEGMKVVLAMIDRVAASSLPVLIEGETGVGKELCARAIHEQSPRRDGPMICINCGAIPEQLVEGTLFGHEKGAFTSASERTKGVFETAHSGTVLLDEISELSPSTQVALLRVLEDMTLTRVGSRTSIVVDVRVVAATNRDLEQMRKTGQFRKDLFF